MESFDSNILKVTNFFLSFLVGSLVFFSLVVAPNIFKNLDQKNARLFVRSIFPKVYLWSFIISFILAILSLREDLTISIILLLISLGFLFSRQYLTKWINNISDQVKKNEKQKKKFLLLHTLSVFIFITQIFLLVFINFSI
tara:strand:+ start:102 stop:524 length:423 start_codon:yes stop_codon:yes gene_type:complete